MPSTQQEWPTGNLHTGTDYEEKGVDVGQGEAVSGYTSWKGNAEEGIQEVE